MRFFKVTQHPEFVFLETGNSYYALRKGKEVEWKNAVYLVPFRDDLYLQSLKQTGMFPREVPPELNWDPVIMLSFIAQSLESLEYNSALPEIALY